MLGQRGKCITPVYTVLAVCTVFHAQSYAIETSLEVNCAPANMTQHHALQIMNVELCKSNCGARCPITAVIPASVY